MSEPTINRRVFMAALGKLVSPMDTAGAVNALMAFLPFLTNLPEPMFDDPTMLAGEIALSCERVPTLAKLRKALEAVAERHKPPAGSTLPPELADAALSTADKISAKGWLDYERDAFRPEREVTANLAVTRRYHEGAFLWLIENNTRARSIAEHNGWMPRVPNVSDFTDPGRILASVRNIVEPMHPLAGYWLTALRAAVEKAAPHLVDLVPLDVGSLEAGGSRPGQQAADLRADDGYVKVGQPPAAPGRKPFGALSPEQLHAVRMNNPALRPIAEREAEKRAAKEFANTDDIPWDEIA